MCRTEDCPPVGCANKSDFSHPSETTTAARRTTVRKRLIEDPPCTFSQKKDTGTKPNSGHCLASKSHPDVAVPPKNARAESAPGNSPPACLVGNAAHLPWSAHRPVP